MFFTHEPTRGRSAQLRRAPPGSLGSAGGRWCSPGPYGRAVRVRRWRPARREPVVHGGGLRKANLRPECFASRAGQRPQNRTKASPSLTAAVKQERPPSNEKPRLPGLFSRAGDGARTHDPQLGKLMLYQLSYAREGRIVAVSGASTTSRGSRGSEAATARAVSGRYSRPGVWRCRSEAVVRSPQVVGSE